MFGLGGWFNRLGYHENGDVWSTDDTDLAMEIHAADTGCPVERGLDAFADDDWLYCAHCGEAIYYCPLEEDYADD